LFSLVVHGITPWVMSRFLGHEGRGLTRTKTDSKGAMTGCNLRFGVSGSAYLSQVHPRSVAGPHLLASRSGQRLRALESAFCHALAMLSTTVRNSAIGDLVWNLRHARLLHLAGAANPYCEVIVPETKLFAARATGSLATVVPSPRPAKAGRGEASDRPPCRASKSLGAE